LVTGGPAVGRLGAVAHVAVALLHAPPPVVAQAGGAGAVAGAAGGHARRHLGALLQVKVDAVDGQRPDAAQEASLLGRRSSCGGVREAEDSGAQMHLRWRNILTVTVVTALKASVIAVTVSRKPLFCKGLCMFWDLLF